MSASASQVSSGNAGVGSHLNVASMASSSMTASSQAPKARAKKGDLESSLIFRINQIFYRFMTVTNYLNAAEQMKKIPLPAGLSSSQGEKMISILSVHTLFLTFFAKYDPESRETRALQSLNFFEIVSEEQIHKNVVHLMYLANKQPALFSNLSHAGKLLFFLSILVSRTGKNISIQACESRDKLKARGHSDETSIKLLSAKLDKTFDSQWEETLTKAKHLVFLYKKMIAQKKAIVRRNKKLAAINYRFAENLQIAFLDKFGARAMQTDKSLENLFYATLAAMQAKIELQTYAKFSSLSREYTAITRAIDDELRASQEQSLPRAIQKAERLIKKCANPLCLNEGPDYKLCSRCRVVSYCSADCQRAHWPSHRSECHSNS